jgi:hypothetical protein
LPVDLDVDCDFDFDVDLDLDLDVDVDVDVDLASAGLPSPSGRCVQDIARLRPRARVSSSFAPFRTGAECMARGEECDSVVLQRAGVFVVAAGGVVCEAGGGEAEK